MGHNEATYTGLIEQLEKEASSLNNAFVFASTPANQNNKANIKNTFNAQRSKIAAYRAEVSRKIAAYRQKREDARGYNMAYQMLEVA